VRRSVVTIRAHGTLRPLVLWKDTAMEALGPLILVAMVVAFYFLLVRPQNRRVQERQALISSLSVGDRIVTAGGFHGRVAALAEETMELELEPGTVVTVERSAAVRTLEAAAALAEDEQVTTAGERE
jgi:preprotein translocase subunit YajC